MPPRFGPDRVRLLESPYKRSGNSVGAVRETAACPGRGGRASAPSRLGRLSLRRKLKLSATRIRGYSGIIAAFCGVSSPLGGSCLTLKNTDHAACMAESRRHDRDDVGNQRLDHFGMPVPELFVGVCAQLVNDAIGFRL